jgi:tRNA A37 threonylcarbamoyladenosine synthetase subunit TsaC/SUA5/YrdC
MIPNQTVPEIIEQFAAFDVQLDFVIDAGELPASKPSTIVDCSVEPPVIVREGAIATFDIEAALAR